MRWLVAAVICGVAASAAHADRAPRVVRPNARYYDESGRFSYRKAADQIYIAKAKGQRLRAGPGFRIPRLPALEHVWGSDRITKPFAGYQIYGLQHIVPTTESLMRYFVHAGADPGIELEGKVYSESPFIVEEMQKAGRHVGYRPWGLHADTDTKESARLLVEKLKAQAAREPKRKFLVIDDGADLIEAVNELVQHDPALAARIVGVQQTRHGTDRLEEVKLHFPVVDIGDSWLKRDYEGPAIGRSCALNIDRKLRDGRFDTKKPLFIVGYGAVGRHTARYLKRFGWQVKTYDKDARRRILALRDGVPTTTTLEAGLAAHDVVIGATGKIFVDGSNASFLRPGARLINVASNGTEFDLFAIGLDHYPENGGAPINFGRLNPVPARYIQVTRGLLYLAGRKAIGLTKPGLYRLDDGPQRKLARAFVKDLGRRGENAFDPSFQLDEP